MRGMLVVAPCLAALPLFAADGVLIVEKTTTAGSTKTSQIQIEPERIRAETGDGQTVIFSGPKQTLWIVNDGRKSYNEITKADVDRMGGQINDAMARMQEQLKALPPAQRAQIENMLKGRGVPGIGGAPPKIEYRKTGSDKVGSWTCDKYEGMRNGQKVNELCTVDPKVLGFAISDFQVARQLMDFFGKLVPAAADQMFTIGTMEEQGFSGVPVRRITFSSDQRQSVSEMTQATRQAFAAATFEVPSGYQKEAFGLGRGRQ
jgi:hypothetical protein